MALTDAQSAKVRETLETMLRHLCLACDSITVDNDEKTRTVRFLVSSPDSALLIGEHGARLQALNHIMKKIFEREWKDEQANFMVDVNDYQKKRLDDLRAKAHMLAERARYFRSSVEMDPMSSYERMIIHAEFTDVSDIETVSQGGGKERRVVLKFVDVV